MKTCGHTMGTPRMDALQAMEFFASIGHQGIEFRCAADGQLNPDTYTPEWGERARRRAAELGLEIACLTPYYRDFVNPEKRESELAGMRRVIDIAAELGCPLVRSYGGVPPSAAFDERATRDATIAGLRVLADYAAGKGVALCIETHAGSLTLTAEQTADLVEAVDRPNVGVLFDYAWVHYAAQEHAEEAVERCAPYILHCHVKDWSYERGDPERRRSRLMGEGEVDWPVALAALKRSGYDGFLSDEYEKYWYDHLPEPEVGMRHNAEVIRRLWEQAPAW